MRASIAALGVALVAAGVQAQDELVKVMSFNLRTSDAPEDKGQRCSNWAGERKGNVASQIMSVSPDFVGTQETSDSQKAFLDDELKATYRSIGVRTGSLNGAASEVNAIWYKHNDWEKIVDGTFWFGPNTEAQSAAWNMKYYRTFTYGRFKHIKSGRTVCVLNTHYETPGNDLAQNEASKIIIAKTPAICSGDDKIKVLTGDFNANPNYGAMQTLFADGWVEKSNEPTFCGDMLNPTCQTKYDFTLHKLAAGVCTTKSEVLRTAYSGCYPSDHAVVLTTFCISGSCCGGSGSRAGSSGGSRGGDGDIKPGVVVPPVGGSGELLLAAGGDGAPGGAAPGPATNADGTKAGDSGSGANEITTKSAQSTNATGTVFAIMGVLAAVGAVCAFVVKKKRALDAKLDGQKSGLAPMPTSFFSHEEEEALSPRRSGSASTRGTQSKLGAFARKFSSPVPTLETITEEERKRSFSATSSIPCSLRESVPMSPSEYNESLDRYSSPVMMAEDGRSTGRESSRMYFSEVVSQRNGRKPSSDFALL